MKRLFLLNKNSVLTATEKKSQAANQRRKPTGTRKHPRINVAVPVKITSHDNSILSAAACTYEVSLHGCKLANTMGLRTVDQLVWINRKNRRAAYKVVWTSLSKNQVGLQIAESEKLIWDDELVGQLV